MKAKLLPSSSFMILRACLALSALLLYLAIQPVRAAPQETIVGGTLPLGYTIWTVGGNPYLVDSSLDVPAGATLTIQEGVVVQNYYGNGSQKYNFDVEGTLVVNGTALLPVHFLPGLEGWSGINITGAPGDINTGSSLSYVVLDGGGYGGSGVAANLRLQYATVDVDHSQFINSPSDGILGDDASGQGNANISDSSFTNNQGYAVNFQDGSVNPILSNLTATGNGSALGYNGNLVNINDATLSAGLHIWENMGLPYLILGTMVGPDSQLTIEPGVQVLSFLGNDNLVVQGSLLADGTADQVIHFDPLTTTLGWSGIAIMGTDVFPSAGGVLNHVSITKGGVGGNCDLYVEYGNARVTNSQLDSSQDSGVCLDHGASLVMTDTQLTNNQEYAMDVIDAGASFYLDSLTASGNLSDTIGIQGGTLTGEHTWAKSGINTYDLHYNYVTIAPTGTLTIEPGVTVLFGETRDITVHGILNAIGTPTESITFTSETHPQGLWAGLSFIGTAEQHAVGHLAYATAEYGGYGGSAMIYIENADVTFTHCILRYCAHDAIEIQPGRAVADQSVGIGWSRLHDIGGYAIQNGSSQAVQAIYNWWGAASGPTADGNPGGTGSSLLGPVNYWPFLIAPEARIVFLPLSRK
jgi:hypothetical protein